MAHAGGRPTKMTELTLKKLEEAFAMGCSDTEACLYADISHQTLYTYQGDNPEFLERKNKLKETPVLLARQSVLNGMREDPKLAMDYLKNKRSDEFNTKQNVDSNQNVKIVVESNITGSPNTK